MRRWPAVERPHRHVLLHLVQVPMHPLLLPPELPVAPAPAASSGASALSHSAFALLQKNLPEPPSLGSPVCAPVCWGHLLVSPVRATMGQYMIANAPKLVPGYDSLVRARAKEGHWCGVASTWCGVFRSDLWRSW